MLSYLHRHGEVTALGAFCFFCLLLWQGSADMMSRWAGVPPVPSRTTAAMATLGDTQLAYRSGAITLQHLGDNGGRVTPLKEYDYAALARWFDLLDSLDPAADHVPFIAAYYFGASRVPADISYIVGYLARVGQNPAGEKWRWLGYAAYLARHRLDDLSLALDLAYTLSRMELHDDTMPVWARQMPAFILKEQGDAASARTLIENMLAGEQKLHPNEVNFLKSYLTDQLGTSEEEVNRVLNLRGGPAAAPPHY